MKKSLLCIYVCLFTFLLSLCANAESNFARALRTCEPYSLNDSLTRRGETFNFLITLENSKKKKACIYKEKIYQGPEYQMLSCEFGKEVLPYLADAMEKHYNLYKMEILKEKIFEAKMSSNEDILKKYLSNPQYCNITYESKNSKKK